MEVVGEASSGTTASTPTCLAERLPCSHGARRKAHRPRNRGRKCFRRIILPLIKLYAGGIRRQRDGSRVFLSPRRKTDKEDRLPALRRYVESL